MHDCIDVELLYAAEDGGLVVDIAENERKVVNSVQTSCVVECGTIVELVEADDMVRIRVGECQMPCYP